MSLHQHGNRTLDIDQLAVGSGLEPINSNLKVAVGMFSLFICLISNHYLSSSFVALTMVLVTLHLGKINDRVYWNLIWIPITFIILSGIVLLVDISNVKQGFLDIPALGGYLSITKVSLYSTFQISMKALCSVTCLYMISLSTPMYEIIGVLKRCKVPEIIIELMYLMYRFIFIVLETYHNMKTSAQARLGYVTIRQSYRSFFGICMNLLVVAFGKASRSFDAMEARGYDGTILFLEIEKKITKKQAGLVGIYFTILLMLLILERTGI